MTTDDLRALLDAAGKATPGKWEFDDGDGYSVCRIWAGRRSLARLVGDDAQAEADAAYIAAASPDVVASLARIALAAVQWGHSATSITTWDQFEADERSLYDALRDAGLLG